jgi:hypothetical protein
LGWLLQSENLGQGKIKDFRQTSDHSMNWQRFGVFVGGISPIGACFMQPDDEYLQSCNASGFY